jgi:hypothetical protein
MGFTVQIQADYGSEILSNYPMGGKAVFAFLMGLQTYCTWDDDGPLSQNIPGQRQIHAWYAGLDAVMGGNLCATCQAFLDSMWGDGGDSTEYREDEYDFYVKRGGSTITEAQFLDMVRRYEEHWQPIDDVLGGVRALLHAFANPQVGTLESFYVPEDSLPDFEALATNLAWLADRGNDVVRLNFS